jgi:prevent-host-death family protein
MTYHDYLMTMKRVGIAELKSRLSEHLRFVRRGQPITVMDRDTPVARIVPCETPASALVIRPPRRDAPKPGRVPLPPALPVKQDIVRLLLEERQAGR